MHPALLDYLLHYSRPRLTLRCYTAWWKVRRAPSPSPSSPQSKTHSPSPSASGSVHSLHSLPESLHSTQSTATLATSSMSPSGQGVTHGSNNTPKQRQGASPDGSSGTASTSSGIIARNSGTSAGASGKDTDAGTRRINAPNTLQRSETDHPVPGTMMDRRHVSHFKALKRWLSFDGR